MRKVKTLKPLLLFSLGALLTGIVSTFVYDSIMTDSPMIMGEFDEDATPPALTEFQYNSSTINTETTADTVYLTMRITDDLSGVGQVYVRIAPLNLNAPMYYLDFELISGDEFDGVYQGTKLLPKGTKKGLWRTESVVIYDGIGNIVEMNEDVLEGMFGTDSGNFTNLATVDDSTAPTLTSFTIPSEYQNINTENDEAEVIVNFSVTDNMSGVNEVYLITVTNPYIGQRHYMNITEESRDGMQVNYQGSVILPRGSRNGYWEIEALTLIDSVGNQREYDNQGIITLAGLNNSRYYNSATVYDITHPQITSFAITPTEFNTSLGPILLTLDMTVTDDMSGFSDEHEPTVRIAPIIGSQIRDFVYDDVQIISDLERRYIGTVTIPQFSKVGIWQPYIGVQDKVGNITLQALSSNYLNQNVPDASGATLVNTALENQVVIERSWTLASENITITFPINTTVTKQSGGSFAFYRMLSTAYDLTEFENIQAMVQTVNTAEPTILEECTEEEECALSQIVTSGLVGEPQGFVRAGIPGLNLLFNKPLQVSLKVNSAYNGWRFTIQSFQEGGSSWATDTTCVVTNGYCTFNTTHASFFSANKVNDNALPRGSIKINSNANVTTSNIVNLTLAATDDISGVRYMRFSNDGKKWTGWKIFATTYNGWNIKSTTYGGNSNEGTRYVYVQYKDRAGRISTIYSNRIIYNPRKVTPITFYRGKKSGTGNSEYVIIRNNLRGSINLRNWTVRNAKGTSYTIPNVSIGAYRYKTIYTGKGTNSLYRIYLGKTSKTNLWNSTKDTFNLYTDKALRLYRKSF